jgi:VTC domain
MSESLGEAERRFFVTRAQAEAFLTEVAPRLTLEVHDAQRPLAFARTTYLDTDDLIYYNSSREQVRRRLRVREYAAASEPDDEPILTGVCALELKETEGVMRSKARLVAPADVIAFILDSGGSAPPAWKDRLSRMRAFGAIQESLRFDIPSPRVTTFYRRASLAVPDGNVRITLDEGARYCRPVRLGKVGDPATPPEPVADGPRRILEIKTLGTPPTWLTAAMDAARLEPAPESFSKFTAAMEIVLGRAARGVTAGTRPIAIPSMLRIVED